MRPRTLTSLGAATFFTALAMLVYVLLPPGFALLWDNIAQNFPTLLEVHRQMREGQLPLWNPYIWSGAPLLADPQSQALYPFAWLVFELTGPDHVRALDLQYAIHLALGGTFFFLYLGTLGTTAAGALLGALVYALNPHFMWLGTGFTNWYTTFAWIPLILYGIERARTGSARWLGLSGAAFAMQLFAGFPQLSAYTVLLVVPYAAARATDSATTHRGRTAVAGAAAVACGVALAAVLLLPARDMWAASQRAIPPQGSFGQISITWRGLAAVALPGLRSLPVLAPNAVTHLGLVPCLLALLALSRPNSLRVFLGATGFLGILLSAGEYGPFAWVLLHAPGLQLFRGPFKFFPVVVFSVATLAALGLTDWQRESRDRALGWLLVAGLAACLASALLALSPPVLPPMFRASGRFGTQLVVAALFALAMIAALWRARAAILPLALAATLAAMGIEASVYRKESGFKIPTVFWGNATARLLPLFRQPLAPFGRPGRVVWTGTLGLYHRIEMANGYSGLINQRYGEALAWGQHGAWVPWTLGLQVLDGRNRMIDVLDVRYLALPADHAESLKPIPGITQAPRYRLAASFGGTTLVENTQRLPRAYLATSAAPVPDQESALALLRTGAVDPERTPVVEEPVPELTGKAAARRLRLLGEGPDMLHLRTGCTQPAILVISDAFDPGWRARVDGVPQRVLRTNGLTRGVMLPAGKHDVLLYYWPESLTRGALVSAATIMLLVGLVLPWRRPPKPAAPSSA